MLTFRFLMCSKDYPNYWAMKRLFWGFWPYTIQYLLIFVNNVSLFFPSVNFFMSMLGFVPCTSFSLKACIIDFYLSKLVLSCSVLNYKYTWKVRWAASNCWEILSILILFQGKIVLCYSHFGESLKSSFRTWI